MPSPRSYTQVERLLAMARMLVVRATGITIEELVEMFGVSKRTVYRDINFLESAGFPILRQESGDRTAYRLPPDFRGAPLPTFELSELMALRLSKNQLRYLKGTPLHKDFDSIYRKIEKILPARFSNQMDHFEDTLFVHPEAPKVHSGLEKEIQIIEDSLRRCRALTFEYQSRARTRPKQYLIHPYGLVSFKRGLYLLAFVPEYQEIRYFALDSRVKGVAPTDEGYEIPEDFSIETYTQSAFGIITGPPAEVKVEFSKQVAANVSERIWHLSQKVEKRKGGKAVLTMKVAVSPELTAWILSFGPHAKVIKPEKLKREVVKELKETQKRYELRGKARRH